MFLSESIDFINKLPNIYTNFDDATKENNINSANLLHNIVGLYSLQRKNKHLKL